MGSYDSMEAGRRTKHSHESKDYPGAEEAKGGVIDSEKGKANGMESGRQTKVTDASGGVVGDYNKAGNGGKCESW